MECQRDTYGVAMSLCMTQEVYIQSVIRRSGMGNGHPVVTLMVDNLFSILGTEKYQRDVDAQLYEQTIGSLLHIGLCTRPDILVSVLILSRFQQDPATYCHRAGKRLLRTLKGTTRHHVV